VSGDTVWRIVDELVDVGAYTRLRRSVGWGLEGDIATDAVVRRVLDASLFGVIAVSNESQVVGMARVMGDGIIYNDLVDVVVAPGWQHMGIGSALTGRVMALARERGVRHMRLFCESGVQAFYEGFGWAVEDRKTLTIEFPLCVDGM
jgi:GNAT superfamily N-acetyltransferase